MIIFIFLHSVWRLSLLSSHTPAAVTHSRVNGENPSVLSVLCGRQMLPCNVASEQGQMAINENKWLRAGYKCLCAGDEKKVPDHRKSETAANFLQEYSEFFLKMKTLESYVDFKWEVEIWVVACTVLGAIGLCVGSILQQQPCRNFPVLIAGCWMDVLAWGEEVLVCEGPNVIKADGKGVWVRK